MKCEKCGAETWSKGMVQTQTLKLIGGCMAELCLPCQRAWVLLVKSDPKAFDFEWALATKELTLARAHSACIESAPYLDTVERLYKLEHYFFDLSIRWLAEASKAQEI